MTEFESYCPESWVDQGLLVAIDLESKQEFHKETRSLPWGIQIPHALIAAGVFAAGTFLFGPTTAGASALDAVPLPIRTQAYLEPPKDVVLSPLRTINRDFNALFEGMRSGTKVIALEDMRSLAKRAAQHRDEKMDVDKWAKRLADDVKDADD